jgi:hypothetical protein
MSCLECHEPEGHKIPRGRNSTDLVANDLPDKEVSCEKCHDAEPHSSGRYADQINRHGKYIACETCHIHDLHEDNLVLLDWTEPVFDKEEGLWDPKILLKSGDPKTAILYLWFNGNGTFLANALGNHPDKTDSYDPLMNQMVKFERFADLDLEARGIKDNDFLSVLTPEMKEKRKKAIANNLKEWMNKGESKIYPFKIFNARMYEDMANQGPFGAMILPFDYKIYNEKGNPLASVRKAMSHPIVKRMYGLIFKIYMMDKFMHYFGVDTWNSTHPFSDSYEGKVEAHWMRQVGTLMLNHSIKSEGIGCKECHSPEGRLDFEALGYTKERADLLKDFAQIEDKK